MSVSERRCLPTFADLVDELTINQIKEIMLSADRATFAARIEALKHDIDLVLRERGIELSARLVHIVVVLAQMNLHIWMNKDRMEADPAGYAEHLTRAHQLNGIRNQMRNLLLEASGELQAATRRSNASTDGLPTVEPA